MKTALVVSLLLLSVPAKSQEKNSSTGKPTTVGFELDALPYITRGYYASLWMGHNHMRYRAIITEVTTPDFFLEDGFTNNKIHVYAAIADYFFSESFEKWWAGAGVEYWKGQIQTNESPVTEKYNNTVITIGTGYVWKFYRNFYLNPWAAIHVRVAGEKSVKVYGEEFNPSALTPEISLKIGWHF